MQVLIVGPSIEKTKGGMATVISSMLTSFRTNKYIKFKHLVSHVEGSIYKKLFYTVKCIIYLVLQRKSYEIVHIHVASYGSFFRKSIFVHLCKVFKKSIIIHVHGADFDKFYSESSCLIKNYVKVTFKNCNKVFVLSNYWYNYFKQNIISKNLEIIHNGVDINTFRQSYAHSPNFNRFLFLGRFGKRKGVYDLLEAIRILVKDLKQNDLQFFFAGDGELEKVRYIINKEGLKENVHLLGWIDGRKKMDCLKDIDALILPSYEEGLPMAILEAMACGKIIISTNVGGIPDLVSHGDNGFIVKPGDIPKLIESINKVRNCPDEMIKISYNNLLKIGNCYNLEIINNRMLEIYSEISK